MTPRSSRPVRSSSGKRRARRIAAAVAMAALVAGGCTQERAPRPPLPPPPLPVLDEAPSWIGGTFGQTVAAAGDDLVFPGDPCDGEPPVLRRPDGTWLELPELPGPASVAVPLGDTILVWGAAGCPVLGIVSSAAPARMFLLAEDRSEWQTLDVPDIEINSETEAATDGAVGDHAVINLAGTDYLVDRDGTITPLRTGPSQTMQCLTEERVVYVPFEVPEPLTSPFYLASGEVRAIDLDRPDGRNLELGPVPADTRFPIAGVLCGPSGLSLISESSSAEYDAVSDSWRTIASDYQAVVGRSDVPHSGQVAWAPDGSTVFVIALNGRVVSRTGDAGWVETGEIADVVVATDSAVYAFIRDPFDDSTERVEIVSGDPVRRIRPAT